MRLHRLPEELQVEWNDDWKETDEPLRLKGWQLRAWEKKYGKDEDAEV